MKLKNVIAGLAGLLVFLSLDQLTKYLAVAFLKNMNEKITAKKGDILLSIEASEIIIWSTA